MATSGLFFGWDRPITGREKDANEVFAQSINYFNRMRQEGKIESFEPVLLHRHGGDLNGFILVRGDAMKLAQMQETQDYRELMLRVDHTVRNLGIIHAVVGDGVADEMKLWQKTVLR